MSRKHYCQRDQVLYIRLARDLNAGTVFLAKIFLMKPRVIYQIMQRFKYGSAVFLRNTISNGTTCYISN